MSVITFKSTLAIIAICLYSISFLSALERTEQKRLIHVQNYDDPGMGMGVYITENSYFYQSDQPELLDSVRITEERYPFGDCTVSFDGNILFYDHYKQIEYYTEVDWDYNDATHINGPSQHLVYVQDTMGRTLSYQQEDWHSSINDYLLMSNMSSHYNADGYVDSMYVYYRGDTGGHNYCYTIRTFSNSMLQSTTYYRMVNNQWVPDVRYTYSYPATPVQYPAFIRFDNLTGRVIYSSFYPNMLYNPRYVTESILIEWWDYWGNNGWQSDGDQGYYSSIDNDGIQIGRITDDTYSGYEVDWEGNVLDIFEGGGDMASGYTFTWDTVVSSEDHLAPVVDKTLKAYPNPFRTDLNLAISSKDPAPADISIYNVKGQLIHQWKGSKATELVWDGKDASGFPVSSGIYLVKSRQGGQVSTAKVLKF